MITFLKNVWRKPKPVSRVLQQCTWHLKEQRSPSNTGSFESSFLEHYFFPISETLPLDLKQKLVWTQAMGSTHSPTAAWPCGANHLHPYHLLRVMPQPPSAPPTNSHSLESTGIFCWIKKKKNTERPIYKNICMTIAFLISEIIFRMRRVVQIHGVLLYESSMRTSIIWA